MSEPVKKPQETQNAEALPIVVKKYANRRLYNTESSSYITLDNLAEMVRQGRDFVVYDAKSGDDITRSVLTQIIVEEEGKGRNLLPTAFLRQLIGFYGDNLQSLVPRYLEQAMAAFAHQQEQMRRAMQQTMGNLFPFGVEEMGRQNRVMMERAMSMFAPFYRPTEGEPQSGEPLGMPAPTSDSQEIERLRAEIQTLREELSKAAPVPAAKPVLAAVPSTSPAGISKS
jgi:polyhydroxyalkanoate synthesis repressor PhaR